MRRKSQQKKSKKSVEQSKRLSKKAYDNTYSLEAYREQKAKTYVNPYAKASSPRGTERQYINPYEQTYKKSYSSESYRSSYKSTQTYVNPYSTYNSTSKNSGYSHQKEASHTTRISSKKPLKQEHKLSRQEAVALKKKNQWAYKIRIVGIIFAVIVGVFISIKAIDLFTYPTISYETVKLGMIDNSTKSEGIIVRNEKVYTSTLDGNVHYLTNEGEKVKKEGEVCYVANDKVMTAELKKVEEIDGSIYNIQDKRQNLSNYQTEVNTLNHVIKNEMDSFYKDRNTMNTQSIYSLRNQLDRAVQMRTNIYVNDTTERINDLQSDRMKVMNGIKGTHEVIKSEKVGIISYQIDSFEETLGSKDLEGLNLTAYKEILNKDKSNSNAKSIIQAIKGAPLYKIILDDTWSIVSYVEAEDASKYELGKLYDLYFDNLNIEKVSFKLTVKQEEGKKVKLVFETSDQIGAFLHYRTVNFTIGKQKAQGLKIPLTAIVEKNLIEIPEDFIVTQSHGQGVLRKIGETAEFVPVNVQYTEDKKVYVLQEIDALTALTIGQTIEEPNTHKTYTVGEMRRIQGVYTINGRYAKFKKVTIEMQNSDYGIVSEKESMLKALDQIISNPKSVKEDQLLKYMNIQNE